LKRVHPRLTTNPPVAALIKIASRATLQLTILRYITLLVIVSIGIHSR
jgi:hypothetical protein